MPRSKLHSRYGKRGTTAPTTLSGRLTMAAGIQPTALVGIPDRFESEQANHNVPPPGAYNVAQAYDQVAERGKLAIRSAFTAEQSPKARANKTRPTYFDRVESRSPGPSWYDMPQADKPEYNKFLAEGAPSQDKEVGFLGRAPRVPESARQAVKNSSMPAPNNYSVDQHSLDKNVQKVVCRCAVLELYEVSSVIY